MPIRSSVHIRMADRLRLVGAVDAVDCVAEIQRGRRPNYAYVPGVAEMHFVADLDRVMTVEKAVVASWSRVVGCRNDGEVRQISSALARKRARVPGPILAIGHWDRRPVHEHSHKRAVIPNVLRALLAAVGRVQRGVRALEPLYPDVSEEG